MAGIKESVDLITNFNAIRDNILAKVGTKGLVNIVPMSDKQCKMIDSGLVEQITDTLAKLDCNGVRVAVDVLASKATDVTLVVSD